MSDTMHDPEARLASFRSRRAESVVKPQGPLALINTQWIDAEQTIYGVRGRWAPAPGGLTVTAEASDTIDIDGARVDGTVLVRGKDHAEPSSIEFGGTVTGFVIAGENGAYGLRVWDAASEAIREFGSIDAFDYNPDWVVTATFTENPAGTTLGFEHLKDGGRTREEVMPGDIAFTRDGVGYHLAAFKSGKALQLVFADKSNGVDTYSVGRFLFVVPNSDGTITLDFNLAVLPPCAFSYNFNCPLPPRQNRFDVRIEAGEKTVLKADGSKLHPE